AGGLGIVLTTSCACQGGWYVRRVASRRLFLGWLTALVALPRLLGAGIRRSSGGASMQAGMPPRELVRALGAAVLPGELGEARIEVAGDAFSRWMAGYRAGAELLHPYGSPRISYSGPSPVPQWSAQLTALDRAARGRHRRGFAAISASDRQALVRQALAEPRIAAAISGERLPSVAAAPHVALALLAHFYGSREATDLCYGAQIGRSTCRPLVHSARKPLPLAAAATSPTEP
ncbi:MAG: hypothetical protein ACT4R6_09675, partial [Gemmatimonadaceae bacterium]